MDNVYAPTNKSEMLNHALDSKKFHQYAGKKIADLKKPAKSMVKSGKKSKNEGNITLEGAEKEDINNGEMNKLYDEESANQGCNSREGTSQKETEIHNGREEEDEKVEDLDESDTVIETDDDEERNRNAVLNDPLFVDMNNPHDDSEWYDESPQLSDNNE